MLKSLILIILALAVSACGGLGQSPISWPDAVKCAPDTPDAIGDVSEVLLGERDNVTAALEELAEKHGPDIVLCLVDRLVADWQSPGAAVSGERVRGVARGRAFLEEVGAEVER